MKKRIMAIIVSAAAVLSLAACSNGNGGTAKGLSNEYVTINKYQGLEIEKVEKAEVTEDVVESTINGYLSSDQSKEEITDRPAQLGDVANIDYTGSFDGVEFDGGSAEAYDLELGSGSFISATEDYEGFEDQIVGHQTGEEFDITVQFPDPYQNQPDYAGKVAVFHIKLNGIYTLVTPELTDEWVKDNSEESTTVDEYREEIRAMLEKNYEATWKTTRQNEVMDAFMENVEVKELPQDQVDSQYEKIETNYKSMASAYGLEFADLLTNMGMDEDSFKDWAEESAQATIKRSLACHLLIEKMELEPTDEEYTQKTEEYAKDYGYEVDEFISQFGEEMIHEAVLQEKAADFLLESCVEVEESEDSTTDDTGEE